MLGAAGCTNARLPERSRFGKGRWAKNFHTQSSSFNRPARLDASRAGTQGAYAKASAAKDEVCTARMSAPDNYRD